MLDPKLLQQFTTMMKIASAGLQAAGQATGNKYLTAAGGVAAGAGTVVPGVAAMQAGTANADVATPSPKPVAPPKPTPGPTVPESTIQAQKAAGRITNVPKPQAELLKVNPEVKPGGYTKPGLQEAYLKGLEQSGAKLDNKGQIVKQSGQAFKKPGWDRKAQLMGGRRTPDRLHRLRMLAIDKASVKPEEVQAATPITQKAETKREAADHQRYSPSKEFIETGEGENTRLWDDRGIVPKSEPESEGKPIRLPVENFDEEKYYKHKNGNWYKKGYDPGVTPL